jgi:hypothetical protein
MSEKRSVTDAIEGLKRTRAPIDRSNPPPRGGVYAVFLQKPGALAPFSASLDGLIYVGCSSDLAAREFDHHFDSKRTGFSTLRRSIGAIFK